MKHQLLKIKTPNKMFLIKGKLMRSPLSIIVTSQEQLSLLLTSINSQSAEYSLEDVKPKEIKPPTPVEITSKPIKKKTRESSPKTTLEKIAAKSEDK